MYSGNSQIYLADLWFLVFDSSGTWRWRNPAIRSDQLPPARFTHSGFLTYNHTGLDDMTTESDSKRVSSLLSFTYEEKDSKARDHLKHLIKSKQGGLTIWGGGNNEDFLDDMWQLNWEGRRWVQTKYAVSGYLPEPKLNVKSAGVSDDLRQAVLLQNIAPATQTATTEALIKVRGSSPNPSETNANDLAASHNGMEFDLSLGSGHTVMLIVDNHRISVSKAILTARSRHFRTMFTSKMRESRERVIALPNIKLDVFLFILHYIYCGDIPTTLTPTTQRDLCALDLKSNSIQWPCTLTTKLLKEKANRFAEENANCLAEPMKLETTSSRKRKSESRTVRKPKKVDAVASSDTKGGNYQHAGLDPKFGDKTDQPTSPVEGSDSESMPMNCNDLKQVLMETVTRSDNEIQRQRKRRPLVPPSPSVGDSVSSFVDPFQVLVTADRFALDDLRDLMEMAVSKHITTANVCSIIHFAEYYHLRGLMQSAVMHVVTHFDDTRIMEFFRDLDTKVCVAIIEAYRKIRNPENSRIPHHGSTLSRCTPQAMTSTK